MEYHLQAKSSTGAPYDLAIRVESNSVKISCSCQAGKMGTLCKHKLGILAGNPEVLYDASSRDTQDKLIFDINGHQVLRDVRRLQALEAQIGDLQIEAKKLKASVTKALSTR